MLHPELGNASHTLHFDTLSGRLSVCRSTNAAGRPLLELSLPAAPPTDPLPPSLAGDAGAAALAALVTACTSGLGAAHVGL